LSAPSRPPWRLVTRDQLVLYVLGLLILGAVAARYGIVRWRGGPGETRIEAGESIDYRVNLNEAGPDELDLLPGIGPAKAERIVAHRQAKGPFTTVDDLARVPGISDTAVAKLRGLVTVDADSSGGEAPE
jgi:competence ComEA-like helix-hairpin-helix protein